MFFSKLEDRFSSKDGSTGDSGDDVFPVFTVPRLHLNKKLNLSNEDFNTPPQSPGIFGLDRDMVATPPVPPPRPKRDKKATTNLKCLRISPEPYELLESNSESIIKISTDTKDSGDLRPTRIIHPAKKRNEEDLKGYLHILSLNSKGQRQINQTRWFVYDRKRGSLKYFKTENDKANGAEALGEIHIASATFFFEVEADVNGEFKVCSKSGDHLLSAGSPEKRMYWLQQLQKARREFSSTRGQQANPQTFKFGLLSSPQFETADDLTAEEDGFDEQDPDVKEQSPFKDLMPSLERPIDMYTSPPKSADYYSSKKNTFFGGGLGLISRVGKPNFRLPRSASMRTPSPPASGPRMSALAGVCTTDGLSPPPYGKPLGVSSSTPGSFQALTKLRKSLRDKKSSSSAGLITCNSPSRGTSPSKIGANFYHAPLKGTKSFGSSREEVSIREDELQALREEAQVSKDVIGILKLQVEELQKEKDTLTELQKPNLDDGQLLQILRGKDSQIVALETQTRDLTKEYDMKEQQIQKLQEEIKTFKDFLEAKDESLVRLTNQLHEIELSNVMLAATVSNLTSTPHLQTGSGHLSVATPNSINQPPSTPLGLPPKHPSLMRLHSNSNGISFDSDKGEFKEFIDVGSQTNEGTYQCGAEIIGRSNRLRSHSESNSSIDDREIERLQDMVTAYEMQNRFLNKEVLELNHLRQQACDREQKLYLDGMEWEAKFYQIQSKYLLLLNELHNPQDGVSSTRKEMVAQLLRDIVETEGEKQNLEAGTDLYDRFGFRLSDNCGLEGEGLEERAEKLRKQALDHRDNAVEVSESCDLVWESFIQALNSRTSFQMTTEYKNLLRQGIPIAQRGAVWKAIVDFRLMRAQNEKFPADYYKLLANCPPTRNLSPAAKQIELDLLRTLPNNKHYDRPNADGVGKLRRVLLAYSVHNPEVEYCQGFNRIAAIALLFMNEEDAFWTLVYIVEHVMPPEYYSRDKQLIGAQVDQEVLKEIMKEKLPRLSTHFEEHGVDPTFFTLNWFLCIFVETIPVKTYLHIWDAFLFEGNKVLFRYAIALMKLTEEDLLQQNDYMTIVNLMRDKLETCSDITTLTQIAFQDLNPFPMRNITNKREYHTKILEAQKKELDYMRQNYRKNSLARASSINLKPETSAMAVDNPLFPRCFPRGERLSSQPEDEEEEE